MTARNQLEVPVPYGIAECNGGILRRGNQLRLIVISKGKQDATLASSGVKIPVNVKMSASMGSSIIQSRSWHEYSGSNEPEQWIILILWIHNVPYIPLYMTSCGHHDFSNHQQIDFYQTDFQAYKKENTHLYIIGPVWEESTGDLWRRIRWWLVDFLYKGPVILKCRTCFHVMILSWTKTICNKTASVYLGNTVFAEKMVDCWKHTHLVIS